ncbi:NAD-dependent epimerase/dehydratase family protein [Campylobacter jejuni]|nr:NAD-dependent epimerase/dehydratase family protein [Campylobacter jejuni]
MKNILVVGGAGYIGSHTLKHLLDNNYNCIVMDNLIYGHKQAIDKRAKFIHADLLDTFSLTNVFKQEKIDAVVHFAAFAYVGESVVNPAKYYQNNVIGTINLLNVMLENNVKDIVFQVLVQLMENHNILQLMKNTLKILLTLMEELSL